MGERGGGKNLVLDFKCAARMQRWTAIHTFEKSDNKVLLIFPQLPPDKIMIVVSFIVIKNQSVGQKHP